MSLSAQPTTSIPLLRFAGNPSPKFIDEVNEAFEHYSAELRDFLLQRGVTIIASKIGTDAFPGEANKIESANEFSRDYFGRYHPNHIGGVYKRSTKIVSVTEYILSTYDKDGHRIDPLAEANMHPDSGGNNWYQSQDIKDTFDEEIGHAIDHVCDLANLPISKSPSFIRAYEADIEAMGGYEGARVKDFGYYLTFNALTEVFASAWTCLMGSKSKFRNHFCENWPNSMAWVKNFRQEFITALHEGPAAVEQFIFDIGEYKSEIYDDISTAMESIQHRSKWSTYAKPYTGFERDLAAWSNAMRRLPPMIRFGELEKLVIRGDYGGTPGITHGAAQLALEIIEKIPDARRQAMVEKITARFPELIEPNPPQRSDIEMAGLLSHPSSAPS